jgi:fluoride exporter
MKNIIQVFIGAGIGGALRYGIGTLLKWNGTSFPWATFMVNCIGSFVIGLALAYANKNNFFADNYKLIITTGICGGFTTFSAISAESMQLIKQGNLQLAFTYILFSLLIGVAVCALGFFMIK